MCVRMFVCGGDELCFVMKCECVCVVFVRE